MSQEKHNLKPVPAFDHKVKGVETILAATATDTQDYTPHEPLHWWYRPERPGGYREGEWREIPADALVQLGQNLQVVQVLADQLEVPHEASAVAVAVTEEVAPSRELGSDVSIQVSRLPPVVPVHIDGEGTTPREPRAPVDVSMSRARVPNTRDEILWVVIRNSANSLGFNAYQDFMDSVFSNTRMAQVASLEKRAIGSAVGCDFALDTFMLNSVDAFRVLRIATELFTMTRCAVIRKESVDIKPHVHEEEARFGHTLPGKFEHMWEHYLEPLGSVDGHVARILPYLNLIRRKLGDITSVPTGMATVIDRQSSLIQEKLIHPVLMELIWSYWMEEGMLVQSFNTITRRFQNLRANGSNERDPLAQFELDPLRPVSNLLWGWVQDEQSRLSVLRRAHEYDHHYGFTLHGKALAELRTIDRRSKFLEAFHNLLWRCMQFYQQDDQTTVIADAFPVLNALKETHYLLAQGAHNQFGNLPSQARQEMMMQQWILSRPEVREFLGTRVMVPYPEAWMDRVDTVKTIKSWTDTSVVHFRDLATFGEQILLSVRWGAWSTINDQNSAANWARYWRAEIQGYIHAYRIATSVDLTADITDTRQAETRFLSPSVHLRNRLLAQSSSTTR
jgi:hypothetical protein